MEGSGHLPNLIGVLASLLLQSLAYGQFFPLAHGSFKMTCSSDTDCDISDGGGGGEMICWWLYEGCNSGLCMCDPRTHVAHPTGRCIRVRRANEPCDGVSDTCSDTLACVNGTCRCPHGHQGASASGLCIHPNSRPLGAKCNPSIDVCYHESAYGSSEREVECGQNGVCRCRDGYKQDIKSCRRLSIWETGCRRDYECEGGAVCVDEQCSCPTGYKSVAGNTKCAKSGATLELPLRSRCDEINERSYCAQGLVCHRCRPNDPAVHICARYSPGLKADNSALQSVGLLTPSRQHLHRVTTFALCLHLVLVSR